MEHIPRLKDMGVEILWLMPIHPIGIKNRKGSLGSYYSVKDFYDINPEFGTKADLRELVEKLHELGIKIIIDWVANHAAWDNVWTITNPEFFVRDETGNFKSPYDWSDVIQIDHSNEAEQDAMINAMEYWVRDFDIDGFRADLAHLTPLDFWKLARKRTELVKPGLVWLAETEEISYHDAFDISYAWAWMHATESFFKNGHDISELIHLLEKQKNEFPSNALHLYFTSNHDENSWNGTEYEKYGIYSKALDVFNCTFIDSVPLIYSGQELPNYKRLEFFEKDEIAWTWNVGLGSFYKTLLGFHKRTFTGGELEFLYIQKNALCFRRTKEENEVLVFLNFEKEDIVFHLSFDGKAGVYLDIFTGEMLTISGNHRINLIPGGYLVLEKQ